MPDVTHGGNDPMGAPTTHRGPLGNCPAPACQDRIAEQQDQTDLRQRIALAMHSELTELPVAIRRQSGLIVPPLTNAAMAVLRGLTLRELEQLYRPNTPPSRPEPKTPPPADRAAVLREEAALIRAHCPDHLDDNSADGAWISCHCDVADDMLRRLAAEAQPDAVGPSARAELRQQLATALVRYDWNAGLSGRDTPSEHHYGEVDAMLAVLYREWPWLRAEAEDTAGARQPDTETPTDDEVRAQIAHAVQYHPGNTPLTDGATQRITDTVMRVIGPVLKQLRLDRDLAIAHDRQPYPTAWAYEQACAALNRKTDALDRVRQLHGQLAEETDLASPDDPITRGAAAKRIATALDGWNPTGAPQCDVEFEGGGRCAKPAGHRPPGSDDPHVPSVSGRPVADGTSEETR